MNKRIATLIEDNSSLRRMAIAVEGTEYYADRIVEGPAYPYALSVGYDDVEWQYSKFKTEGAAEHAGALYDSLVYLGVWHAVLNVEEVQR